MSRRGGAALGIVSAILAARAIGACVGDDPAASGAAIDAGPERGTEGGECFADQTCKVGLECLSGRCVLLPRDGAGSEGGDGGSGGSDAGDAADGDADLRGIPCDASVPLLGEAGGFPCGADSEGGVVTCTTGQTCCQQPDSGSAACVAPAEEGTSCATQLPRFQCLDRRHCDPGTKPYCCVVGATFSAACTIESNAGTRCSATPCAMSGDFEPCSADAPPCTAGTCQAVDYEYSAGTVPFAVCK